ncbi:class I SAM-dependent methyltransferase [Taibaiella soli]|uniref:Methyltransferase type 11 domain-containing protein n=1 Tax=Taibaiella soli TaxID=1649169 RepID=A0A2W2A915_9BACT|nr:class I SAM-dependent methyltransferase [Taibaiella soli]PZF71761.1 hypothetical protein DN068_16990 [Taibaiella soli]
MNNNFDKTVRNFQHSKIHSSGRSLDIIFDTIPCRKTWVFADLACGTGNLGRLFQGKVADVLFIDSSEKMLNTCKKTTSDRGANFILSDCHSLPVDSGFVNIAGCRFAFHHFENPNRVFKEVQRILTPSGIFFIIDLVGSDNDLTNEMNHAIELLHDETHIKSYTALEISELAKDHGFSYIKSVNYFEWQDGISISDWCKITNREKNAQYIDDLLSTLSLAQLSELGYSKGQLGFINHIKISITILKKIDANNQYISSGKK